MSSFASNYRAKVFDSLAQPNTLGGPMQACNAGSDTHNQQQYKLKVT